MSASLADVTWLDAECEVAYSALAVPLGSTEQHGPHLPLSTDTDIAVALAGLLARARPAVAVAPALPYGSSGEHEGFAGTLSIGQQALELALVELCRSASARFERILLINAHGGNAEPVDRAQRRLRAEGRDVRAWAPSWHGDAHAGRTETSLMLALVPAHVRRDEASAGNVAPIAWLLPQLRADGVRAVSPNGVLGDPAGASADEGLELLGAASAELVAMMDAWDCEA
jgi:mycofactocin system creatininase family protein